MNRDLITVIVPIYNAEQYLKECIDSIINQTYDNLEIILINDGSTDNSLEIIEEYKKKDKRIRTISRENKGTLKTRIEGINKSNGKFISFVDSDDWLEYNAIEVLYEKSIRYDADMVRGSIKEVSSREIIYYIKKKTETVYFEDTFKNVYDDVVYNSVFNSSCAQLVKKSVYEKGIQYINNDIKMDEDQETNIHIIDICKKIVLIPNIVYNYRRNEFSVSKKKDFNAIVKRVDDLLFVYKDLISFIDKHKKENHNKALERSLKEINLFLIDLSSVKNIDNKKTKAFLEHVFNSNIIKEAVNNVPYKEIDENKLKKYMFIKNIYNKNYKRYLFNIKLLKVFRTCKLLTKHIRVKCSKKIIEKTIYSRI